MCKNNSRNIVKTIFLYSNAHSIQGGHNMDKRYGVMKLVLSLMVAMCFCFCASQTEAAETIVWKFGHTNPEEHPWNKVALKFKDIVEKESNGRLIIELYPNSTLGTEPDVLSGILLKTADMTMTGGSFEPYTPSAALLEAPWAYKDENHVKKMLESEIGKKIYQDFEDAGFHPLMYNLRSPRNLTSNVPIKTPADLRGKKMRISNTPLQVSMWSKAGATCTTIALSEVFTALSSGVVEMQENPYDMIYNNSFYEVQKYCNETEHVFSAILYVVGKEQYESLPDDLRQIVDKAAAECQPYANELYFKTKDDYKKLCEENGMQINSDVDKEAFRKVMVPAIKDYLSEDLWEMYQAIVALEPQAD